MQETGRQGKDGLHVSFRMCIFFLQEPQRVGSNLNPEKEFEVVEIRTCPCDRETTTRKKKIGERGKRNRRPYAREGHMSTADAAHWHWPYQNANPIEIGLNK